MTKLLPQLVQRFDFVPAEDSQWTTNSGWFVKQNIQVKIIDRKRKARLVRERWSASLNEKTM